MLHHRLGLHEGRRYWLRGLPHIHDGQAKCHPPCEPKHIQFPLHCPKHSPCQAGPCRGYQPGQGLVSPQFPPQQSCTVLLLHLVTPLPSCSLPKLSACQPLCSPSLQQLLQLCSCSTRTTLIPFLSGQLSCLTNYMPKGPSCACSAGEEPGLIHCPSAGRSHRQASKAAETLLLHMLLLLTCSAPS